MANGCASLPSASHDLDPGTCRNCAVGCCTTTSSDYRSCCCPHNGSLSVRPDPSTKLAIRVQQILLDCTCQAKLIHLHGKSHEEQLQETMDFQDMIPSPCGYRCNTLHLVSGPYEMLRSATGMDRRIHMHIQSSKGTLQARPVSQEGRRTYC